MKNRKHELEPYAPSSAGSEIEPSDGGGPRSFGLADDLLRGAEAIAEFLYGHGRHRRKIYHLVQTKRLPVFHLGSTLCARRSTMIAWIEYQEIKATEKES